MIIGAGVSALEACPRRGALIAALWPSLHGRGDGAWLACALSPQDREIAGRRPRRHRGPELRLLELPAELHRRFYDDACVTGLGFVFHGLVDQVYSPTYDVRFRLAWRAYREVNRLFAQAPAEWSDGRAILVEDYHLMLLADAIRRRSRGATGPIVYFHHVPWCSTAYFALLPKALRVEILEKLLRFDTIGFHSRAWADNFLACCDAFLASVHCEADAVVRDGRRIPVVVAPAQIDPTYIREVSAGNDADRWRSELSCLVNGCRVGARVDRIDLWT